MLNRRHWAYADPNLRSALQIFPSDASILFYAGLLHESYAAPMNQNAPRPDGSNYLFSSRTSELEQARDCFQKSVAADPGFAETHLHLGRVLGMLGQHDQAVMELQQASSSLTDGMLLYEAFLFLGHELLVLGRETEAREHYEKAAKLYPTAPSPLLALSQLARTAGDSQGAWMNVQRVFELSAGHSRMNDPWWNYDLVSVRNADALLSKMREGFGGLAR
jgi:tetratricopeptide (TPR) repeat protein